MLTKGFLKPKLSIRELGKVHFGVGLLVGGMASLTLSYFLNYSREAIKLGTLAMKLSYLPAEEHFELYDLFFAAFATSIGFGFTIIYWLRGKWRRGKKKYKVKFVVASAWFIMSINLMLLARFTTAIALLFFGMSDYDNHLRFFVEEFWLLLVLIPMYLFIAQWNALRLVFRTKYWLLLAILVYGLTAFGLSKITSAKVKTLNHLIPFNKSEFYSQKSQRNLGKK